MVSRISPPILRKIHRFCTNGRLGARVPQSIYKQYEEIERELINRVAKPCGLSGGKLDRILFQKYGDIMVRLLRP